MNLHELDLPNCNYILSGIKSPFIEIKGHIPVMHKFCCGTKTAGKTQAATWGSSSKDWAFCRRTQSWKSCLTFSKLMKYSLGFCRNSWSGFGSAAKLTWFSSWIGWIGINLIVKFPLPLDGCVKCFDEVVSLVSPACFRAQSVTNEKGFMSSLSQRRKLWITKVADFHVLCNT